MNAVMYRLTRMHRKLDDEIRREMRRRLPDTIKLLRLKKVKLVIKDRLFRQQLRRIGT